MKRHRQSVESNLNIWLYIAFGLLVLVCFLFIGFKLIWKTEPDLRISYASTEYMNTQTFNDTIGEVELLLRDANGDGNQKAGVEAYYSKDNAEVLKKLEQYIASDSYDIYISTKEAFEAVKDKSVFADSSRYYIIGTYGNDVLEDENGRVYAVSLKDNTLAEYFGILSNENLFIAAAVDSGETTTFRKNGMNISGYIIESKNKYKIN